MVDLVVLTIINSLWLRQLRKILISNELWVILILFLKNSGLDASFDHYSQYSIVKDGLQDERNGVIEIKGQISPPPGVIVCLGEYLRDHCGLLSHNQALTAKIYCARLERFEACLPLMD